MLERELWEGSAAAADVADEAKAAAEGRRRSRRRWSRRGDRVADAQRDESEKRAVAAQAHAAVGSFQGVAPGGGFRLPRARPRPRAVEDDEGKTGKPPPTKTHHPLLWGRAIVACSP